MEINYSDQKLIKGKKSIFSAGPTPRNDDVISWRIEFCKKLEEEGFDGIVYVSEYSSQKPKVDYDDQAMWEIEALTEATVIAFWVPRKIPEMPAFTTNVEFGYWIQSGKVVYGRPNEAQKIKYLDLLYKLHYGKEPMDTIEKLVSASISESNKLYADPKILKRTL